MLMYAKRRLEMNDEVRAQVNKNFQSIGLDFNEHENITFSENARHE